MSARSHTLSVLVEDKPGVLARVSSLFSRRGFNIESLAVGPTETEGLSRMTIVVNVEDFPLDNVIKIVEQDPAGSVARELTLVKVRADATNRGQIVEIASLFRAHIVDVSPESLTLEATGAPDKLEALRRVLDGYGVRGIVQSGMVALGRGPKSINTTR